jgi:hypothetical protein
VKKSHVCSLDGVEPAATLAAVIILPAGIGISRHQHAVMCETEQVRCTASGCAVCVAALPVCSMDGVEPAATLSRRHTSCRDKPSPACSDVQNEHVRCTVRGRKVATLPVRSLDGVEPAATFAAIDHTSCRPQSVELTVNTQHKMMPTLL